MHGKVVLVCTDQLRTWRQLTPPLAGAGNQIVHAQSTERAVDLLASGAVDLALIEWPSGVELDPVLKAAEEWAPVVALVTETGIRAVEELVCRRGLLQLCAARPDQEVSAVRSVDPTELVVTCEKILRRDIFGLDKYLAGFGIERFTRVVTHADERDDVVARLADAVRTLGAGRRLVESVTVVGDELLTNAVYNAPRDASGNPRYAHVSRRQKVALEPGEHVRLEYGSDGQVFGISVTDSFGALAPEALRSCIERCLTRQDLLENRPGGTGIGLYASLCHADHLVLNVEAGVRTEVIALWHLARRTGGRGAGVASLHVFQRGEQIAWPRARDTIRVAPLESRMALTDSVRIALSDVLEGMIDSESATLPRESRPVEGPWLPQSAWVAAAGRKAGRKVVVPAPMMDPVELEPGAQTAAIEAAVTDSMVMEAIPDPIEPDAAAPDAFEPDTFEELPEKRGNEVDPSCEPDGDLDSDVLEVDADLVVEVSPEEIEDLEGAEEIEEIDPADYAEEVQLIGEIELVADAAELADADEVPARSAMPAGDPADTALHPGVDDPVTDGAEPGAPRSADRPTEELVAPDPPASGDAADLADLFEMGSIMEATGMLPARGPAWLGPLTCLRGVQIPRSDEAIGLEPTLARLRESPTLVDAVEVLLTLLLDHWSAAMLLCRAGEMLVPWAAAGDVQGWDELCEAELPLAQGWLSVRTLSPGVTLASLDDDPTARQLSDRLTAQSADQGLALSFALERSVMVVFACRVAGRAGGDALSDYEELQRDLSELTRRIDRISRLPTVRPSSAQAEAG